MWAKHFENNKLIFEKLFMGIIVRLKFSFTFDFIKNYGREFRWCWIALQSQRAHRLGRIDKRIFDLITIKLPKWTVLNSRQIYATKMTTKCERRRIESKYTFKNSITNLLYFNITTATNLHIHCFLANAIKFE